jgi:SAM-dependent methyltransferase
VTDRIIYKACPLCESAALSKWIVADCSWHPLYIQSIAPSIQWMKCEQCHHVFTQGYFTPAIEQQLTSVQIPGQIPGENSELAQHVWAPTVGKVAALKYPGSWLDVGFGNGALLEVAQEWGFTVTGIDTRLSLVDQMNQRGVPALHDSFLDASFNGTFDVISLCDVLEHVPFPKKALNYAWSLLNDDGLLVVSMPNMGSHAWKDSEQQLTNPYWGELEHYHNFTRIRLVSLLEECGFSFVSYDIPSRWRLSMEIVASKASK